MNTKLTGRWGEALAAEYLRKKGYSIIGMSYTTRMGELDVIARKGGYVVFVEVKLRKNDAFAQAREFVSISKQRRILAAAQLWLSENDSIQQPRFDVIEIYAPNGADTKKPKINHLVDAFGDIRS